MLHTKLHNVLLKNAPGICLAILFCFVSAPTATAQVPFGAFPGNTPTEDVDDEDAEDDAQADPIRPRADRRGITPFNRPADEEAIPDQPVELNAKYAGWEGAGPGGDGPRLSDDIRGNWIMVDPNGRFEGRVVPMDNAVIGRMIVFLLNKGRLVKQTSVDENGMYEFKNVRQGAYALIGWSDGAFFSFGLNILSNTEDSNPQIPNRVTTLAFQNRTTINTDWIQFFAPQVDYRVFGRYPDGEGANDSEALYGFIGLVENQPDAVPATSISGHNVAKTPDGRLVGRIHQLTSDTGRPVDVRSTKVMLLQNDGVVAATEADNDGVFSFSDVAPGRYALTAAGSDGAGLVGINVVDSTQPLMNEDGELSDDGEFDSNQLFDFCLISAETMGWLNHYASEVAYRRVLLTPRPPTTGGGCKNCNGDGCNQCNRNGYDGFCKSRSITFNQWASQCGAAYCKDRASKPDGFFGRAFGNLDETFEKAFYSDSDGISGGTGPGGTPR